MSNHWMRSIGSCVCVVLLLTAVAYPRGDDREPPNRPPTDVDVQKLVTSFEKSARGREARRYAELLAAIARAVPEVSEQTPAPFVGSLRELMRRVPDPASRPAKIESNRRKGPAREAGPEFPAAREFTYLFGTGEIALVDPKDRSVARRLAKARAYEPGLVSPAVGVEYALHGALPETDLLRAVILRELDVFPEPRPFACFLESCRNATPDGDESFYDALDRTAGTGQDVFFYDAMLTDFAKSFGGADAKRWSLQTSHQRLHASFLTYRQYRAFVDAVAWSLVLPPDVALPRNLARFDYSSVGDGQLSTRHVLDIYLDYRDDDVGAVVDDVKAVLLANPPPNPLWDGGYCAAAQLNDAFAAAGSAMIAKSKIHTHAMGERCRERRAKVARDLSAAACAELR